MLNSQTAMQNDPSPAIEEQIDRFVSRQRQNQQKLISENRRNNFSVSELVNRSKPLSPDIVDGIFSEEVVQRVPEETVIEVKKALHGMRLKLNGLDPKKRFLILETMDFFRSRLSIGKLIPAILLLKDNDRKKAILEFVIPTFISINKNVELLVSTGELFTNETLHLNRGSLYSFVTDLAKILLPLFKRKAIERMEKTTSPVEMLLSLLKPLSNNSEVGKQALYSQMTNSDEKTRKVLLNFIVAIQSHEALFNYSIKRYGYYKLFLNRLTREGRFENLEPLLASKLLAGCLLANDQMKPDNALINAMTKRETFAQPSTTKARRSFINKLAPSTVFKIINAFKTHLQFFLKSRVQKEFDDIQEFTPTAIMKKVWGGFTRLAEEGLTRLSAPLERIFNQIKSTLLSFIEDEKKEEEKTRQAARSEATFIPKREDRVAHVKKNYELVEPDISGFRGIREGAGQKDFAYNSRFYQKGEITQLEFMYCFKRLFNFLGKNQKLKTASYEKLKNTKEYHCSFAFDNYLISLGITYLKPEHRRPLREKDFFPYVLLFKEDSERRKERINGREVLIKGKQKYFNEVTLTRETAKIFYKSILYILHLLPTEDWNATASQNSIKFLIRELKKHSKPS